MVFNKLVRDRVPEMIINNGGKAKIRIMEDTEYIVSLEKKLDEEVDEYHESKEIEELADILEVIYALCKAQGHSIDELLSTYQKKHDERGGFSKKILLIAND